jgi:hypothetical protein
VTKRTLARSLASGHTCPNLFINPVDVFDAEHSFHPDETRDIDIVELQGLVPERVKHDSFQTTATQLVPE